MAGMAGSAIMGAREALSPVVPEHYPFYAIEVETLLALDEWKPHQTLLGEGKLINLTASKEASTNSEVIFLSHQWTSYKHPDPKGVQLDALKRVIRTLMAGETEVRTNSELENHYKVKLVTSGDEWKAKLPSALVWIE